MINRGRDPPHHGHTESGWESMASAVARRRTPIRPWETSQFRGLAGAQGQLSFDAGCSIRVGDASAVDAPPAALSRCLKGDNPWLQRRLDSITQSLTDRDHVSPASSEHQSDQSGHATDDITARILSVMDEGAAADHTTNQQTALRGRPRRTRQLLVVCRSAQTASTWHIPRNGPSNALRLLLADGRPSNCPPVFAEGAGYQAASCVLEITTPSKSVVETRKPAKTPVAKSSRIAWVTELKILYDAARAPISCGREVGSPPHRSGGFVLFATLGGQHHAKTTREKKTEPGAAFTP